MKVENNEKNISKENQNRHKVMRDPRAFRKDSNVALAVTNIKLALEGSFSLRKYKERGPIQIVCVKNPHTEEVEERIRDGHNRTMAAILAIESKELPEDTQLEFLNVTEDVAREKFGQNRDYLTDEEYYIVLGEETKRKEELAWRRMAGHLFTDWRRWVGDDVANDFSALAALYTLRKEEYRMRTFQEIIVHNAIERSSTPVTTGVEDEKSETTAKIKTGLKTMASRILRTGLSYDEVALAGFELVTSAYEDIGDEIKESEIQGLLLLPEIGSKSISSSRYTEVVQLLSSAFRRITKDESDTNTKATEDKNRREVLTIMDLISSSKIGIKEMRSILDDADGRSITEKYRELIWNIGIKTISDVTKDRTKIKTDKSDSEGINAVTTVTALETLLASLSNLGEEKLELNTRLKMLGALSQIQDILIDQEELEEVERKIIKTARAFKKMLIIFEEDELGSNARTALENVVIELQRLGVTYSTVEGVNELDSELDVLPTVAKISRQARKQREERKHVPDYVIKYPFEIFNAKWKDYKACRDDPNEVNVTGLAQFPARTLCHSCPVMHECLAADLHKGIKSLQRVGNTENEPPLEKVVVYVRGGMLAEERVSLLYSNPLKANKIITDVNVARMYQTSRLKL